MDLRLVLFARRRERFGEGQFQVVVFRLELDRRLEFGQRLFGCARRDMFAQDPVDFRVEHVDVKGRLGLADRLGKCFCLSASSASARRGAASSGGLSQKCSRVAPDAVRRPAARRPPPARGEIGLPREMLDTELAQLGRFGGLSSSSLSLASVNRISPCGAAIESGFSRATAAPYC